MSLTITNISMKRYNPSNESLDAIRSVLMLLASAAAGATVALSDFSDVLGFGLGLRIGSGGEN